jgi:hypothetical protein
MLPSFTGNPDKWVKTSAPIVAAGATAAGLSSTAISGAVATGMAATGAAIGTAATAAAPIVLPALAVWGIWKIIEESNRPKK